MNNTIRIAKHSLDVFTEECKQQGINFINLGEVDGDIRIMLDTDDLLDAYSIGYIMGVISMTERVKGML